MIRIFIGWDTRETAAYHVLAHSIIARSSLPVAISPVGNAVLPQEVWWRTPGEFDSTQFSNARFAVPALCGFKGWAIFMDCDMICLDDIAKLWALRDDRYAVLVRKHDHQPTDSHKFLGARQTRYSRKNWSSLMLLNCEHPDTKALHSRYINEAPGLDLHGLTWTRAIGEIDGSWNELILGGRARGGASMPHFTEGGPWHGYAAVAYAEEWLEELDALLADTNPQADSSYRRRFGATSEGIEYQVKFQRGE